MARGYHLIGLQPGMGEWLRVDGRDAVLDSCRTRVFAPTEAESGERLLAGLDEVLDEGSWQAEPLVVVLPASEISFRRLEFPFGEPRKVLQALPFTLENELLGDLDELAYDHQIVQRPDGSAQVFVYLVPRALVAGITQRCQERGLPLLRITFSAYVLQLSRPAESPWHYQLYCGPDETFISFVHGGHLHTVKSLPVNLGQTFGGGLEPGDTSPAALGALLSAGGEPLQERLHAQLTGLCRTVNTFVRTHAMGRDCTLSLHGLFASALTWDAESASLAPAAPGQPLAQEHLCGVLEETLEQPQLLVAPRQINFFTGGAGLMSRMAQLKGPLIAMAVLLLLFVGLLGTDFYLRTARLNARLSQLDTQIRSRLARLVPGQPTPTTGLRMLQERVTREREEQQAAARFLNYHYDTLRLLEGLSLGMKEFPDLTLDSLTVTADRISLAGTTPSYNASESFKNRLDEFIKLPVKQPKISHQRTGQNIRFLISLERGAP